MKKSLRKPEPPIVVKMTTPHGRYKLSIPADRYDFLGIWEIITNHYPSPPDPEKDRRFDAVIKRLADERKNAKQPRR